MMELIITLSIVVLLIFLVSITLIKNLIKNEDNGYMIIIALSTFVEAMLIINIVSYAENFKSPLGIESLPTSETLSVLAVDTTNGHYFNVMTVNGDKKIRTYAISKKLFNEKAPQKGNSIVLIEIDGKKNFIMK